MEDQDVIVIDEDIIEFDSDEANAGNIGNIGNIVNI